VGVGVCCNGIGGSHRLEAMGEEYQARLQEEKLKLCKRGKPFGSHHDDASVTLWKVSLISRRKNTKMERHGGKKIAHYSEDFYLEGGTATSYCQKWMSSVLAE